MRDVVSLSRDAVLPIIESLGCELVDVEYKSEFGQMNLIFYVDAINKEGGTDFETCEEVHRAISDILDELDPTDGRPYNLNVSSPGLDRPFKTARDYERQLQNMVEVKLLRPMNKKLTLEGVLLSYLPSEGGGFSIVLDVKKLGQLEVSAQDIKLVRRLIVIK